MIELSDLRPTVLVLYSEMASYTWDCLQHYALRYNTSIDVCAYPASAMAPLRFESNPRVRYFEDPAKKRHLLNANVLSTTYEVILVSGWIDTDYMRVLRRFAIPRVCMIDNPYTGSWRQRVAASGIGQWKLRHFTHAWVAGISQYELARRVGFHSNKIVTGLYAADEDRFQPAADIRNTKTVLFAGRLLEWKGIRELCEAFVFSAMPVAADWRLVIVGTGPMEREVKQFAADNHCIEYLGFVEPADMAELYRSADIFCMPSHQENWGVTLHEAALSGLPIVASDQVESAKQYVVDQYNGRIFRSGSVESLRTCLVDLTDRADEFPVMGARSRQLALGCTKQLWSARLHALRHVAN